MTKQTQTRPHKPQTNVSPRRRSAVLPWTIAVVAAAVAIAAILVPRISGAAEGSSGSEAPAPASVQTGDPEHGDTAAVGRREEGDPTALGKTDAPVVMVAYSDFQCPYCGDFARSTEQDLIKKYVATGVLRIEWRDFPYLGKESVTAAHAARAAGAQDRFWQFHDALYAEQLPPNSGKLTREYLTRVADETGLDVERFARDMSSATTAKLVQRDFDEGMSVGVSGTPSFLVNGVPIVGALPLTEFEAAIERALEAAKAG